MATEWSDWYLREDLETWVLPEILKKRAEEHPDRDFLKFGSGEWISYGTINAQSNQIANSLLKWGVRHGESVSVMLPNCAEFMPVWFGILKAGGVMSSINTAYKGDFLAHTINLVEARVLIISDEWLDRLQTIAERLPKLEHVVIMETENATEPLPTKFSHETLSAFLSAGSTDEPDVDYKWTDDARIMFTSGTTGLSKGVVKQHAADYFSGRGLLEVLRTLNGKSLESMSEETFFSCLPLFHSNAQVLTGYPALIAGARVAYVDRFSASKFWQQVTESEATIFNSIGAVSYFIFNTAKTEYDTAHKVHTVFAAPAPKDIYTQFEDRFGVKFVEGYGLTETGMATYMDPTKPPVLGSMGVANPGYEVTIVEPGTDRPLPPNTPGEIVVDMKIPNIVMRKYYGMDEKTAEDFRNLKLHTGDLGRMDNNGYFYFMDRVKDYIRRRGENISSQEVERQVANHPQIKEAACIGVKADEGASSENEVMIVCIADGERPDEVELIRWLANEMPYFMIPRYIRFVDELPKTPTERVQKNKLREEGNNGVTADTFDAVKNGIKVTKSGIEVKG